MVHEKAKLEVIFNLYRGSRDSSHLTDGEAFGALKSIFGDSFLTKSIFDRFNERENLSLQDLAILLIQIDTYFRVLPAHDHGNMEVSEKKRGRSIIRAFSKSMRRMVSRGPEVISEPNFTQIDLASYLCPPPDPSAKVQPVPTEQDEIPPPRTPEERSIGGSLSHLTDRLDKLERIIYMSQHS